MHFLYILQSVKDKKSYVGITNLTKGEAAKREKFLKSSDGRKELGIRFKNSLLK